MGILNEQLKLLIEGVETLILITYFVCLEYTLKRLNIFPFFLALTLPRPVN